MSPSELGLMIKIEFTLSTTNGPAFAALWRGRHELTQRKRRRTRADYFRVSDLSFSGLSSNCEPLGQQTRQTGFDNSFLGGSQIVFDAPLLNHRAVEMINAIGGVPVSIARLADAASVNEIFLIRIDSKLVDPLALHASIANEGDGHMGMSKKTNAGVLVSKARSRIEVVEDIGPLL